MPPPAAAHIAVEQLQEARNKRTDSTHIFIVPRLFTSLWRRQLHRASDLFFELPFVDKVWEKSNCHEPLTLTFVFPFLSHSPWQLRRSTAFLEMGRLLPQMWKADPSIAGGILRQSCSQTWHLASTQESLVSQVLQSAKYFQFSHSTANQRPGSSLVKRKRQESLLGSKKR